MKRYNKHIKRYFLFFVLFIIYLTLLAILFICMKKIPNKIYFKFFFLTIKLSTMVVKNAF
jgi:heme/copper-type cytochrome/quinol oxidase subunit 4